MQRHLCWREAAPKSFSSSATVLSIPCHPHLSLRPHLAKRKLHTLRWFSTLHKLGQKNIDTKKQFTLGCAVPSITGQNSPLKSMILKCSMWVWSIDGEFCLQINDVIWRSVNNFSVFPFPNICSQFCASFSAFGASLCFWKVLVVTPGLAGGSAPLQGHGRFQKLYGAHCSPLSCQYNDNSSHFLNLLRRSDGSPQETGKRPLDKNIWHSEKPRRVTQALG